MLYNIGLIFVWKKEFQVAIDYLKKLLLSDKINPSLYCDLACSYLSIDNFTEAEVYFNKAINLNSANPLAHTGLFLVFKETGQKFKARRKGLDAKIADKQDIEELHQLEEYLKSRKPSNPKSQNSDYEQT